MRRAALLAMLIGCATPPRPTRLEEVSVPDLAERGAATLARLAERPHAFAVRNEQGEGAEIEVRVRRDGPRTEWTVATARGEARTEVARVLVADGRWWLEAGGARTVHRPYEAPLPVPLLYVYVLNAALRPAGPEHGTPRRLDGDHAVLVAPLPEFERVRAARDRQAIEAALASAPPGLEARLRVLLEEVDHFVAAGLETVVSLDTGLVERRGHPGRRMRWTAPSEAPFALAAPDPEGWRDASGPPGTNLVLVGHCAAWQPGPERNACDAGLVTVDLDRGELRRVPYRGPVAVEGCRIPGTRRVLATGLTESGDLAPFAIDLDTGENRALGGPALAAGVALNPACAPDGRRAAIVHRAPGDERLVLHLIDLESGASRPLVLAEAESAGTREFARPSFDIDGALLVHERVGGEDGPAEHHVARIDAAGVATRLFAGESPRALPDGSILYRDSGTRFWYRAMGDGTARRVGDGLPRFSDPALSPDGAQVLMIRSDLAEGPRPFLVELDSGIAVPLGTVGGFWAHPGW